MSVIKEKIAFLKARIKSDTLALKDLEKGYEYKKEQFLKGLKVRMKKYKKKELGK